MSTSVIPSGERELRKAWLKQHFLSYSYHEELLGDYDRWCQLFEQHWNSEKMRTNDPGRVEVMVKQVIPRLREVSRPDTIPQAGWKDGNKSGWASTILYNMNKGMQYLIDNPYSGMSGDVDKESNLLTQKILWEATNIRRTSDGTWEKNFPDTILDEDHTGPIDWPSNWKEELAPALVTSLEQPVVQPSAGAGKLVPRSGWWFTPARANSRRYFQKDEIFPEAQGSDYGSTFWQWSPDQSAPKL